MIVYGPQKTLDVAVGDPTETSAVARIVSLSSGDVTLICNGVEYVVAMTSIGTDNLANDTEACFIGTQTISGLPSEFQRFNYTATQGTNSFTGSFKNKPGVNDTFSIAILTCQDPFETQTWDGVKGIGMLPYIEQRMRADDNFLGIHHCDDLYYSDRALVDDSNGTGKVSTGLPQVTLKEYDWALTYISMCGLATGTDSGGAIDYGHHAAGHYCRANGWFLPQWGNHEFQDVFGTWAAGNADGTAGAARPNPYHATASPGFDGPGLTMYNAFWGVLQPTELVVKSLDTTCNLWAIDIGMLRITSPDNITNNDGTTLKTVAYGANQISDALSAMQVQPFNILTLQHSLRAGEATTSHWNLEENIPAEMTRILSDAGASPPSLCDSRKTNGVYGTTIVAIGDTHRGSVRRFVGTDGDVSENLYAITGMDTNKEAPHGDTAAPDNSLTGGCQYDYIQRGGGGSVDPASPTYTDPENRSTDHALIITVTGSERKMKAEFVNRLLDNTYETVWSRTFYLGRGNSGYEEGVEPAYAMQVDTAGVEL